MANLTEMMLSAFLFF